jgi:tetratricopeptide (TPR) repeat protein
MATFEPKVTRVESTVSVQSKIKAGRELAKAGRMDEALGEIEAALRLDPNSRAAHMAAGSFKGRQGDADEALRHFREVLRIDPLNLAAHLRAARVLIGKKEADRAQELIEGAHRIDPKNPVVLLFLGHLASFRSDQTAAKKYLSEALIYNPRLVRARLQMSAVLRHEGKLDEALGQINAAVRIDPDKANVFDALGNLHLIRKDFGSAREAFEKAISLQDEDQQDSLFGLAEALIEEGQLDRAEEALRRVPSRVEGRPAVHKIWGDLYEKRGLFPEAVEEYRAARALSEKHAGTEPTPPGAEADLAADDLAGWKKLAAAYKQSSDEFRDKVRLQVASKLGEDED